MTINIDFHSRVPIYEQLISEIKSMVISGEAAPDERLPSVRQLSSELGINPNTIQKAYTELDRMGVIYTTLGKGCFISSDTDALASEHKKKAKEEFTQKVREAFSAGVSLAELTEIIVIENGKISEKKG